MDEQTQTTGTEAPKVEVKKDNTKWIIIAVVVIAVLYGGQYFFSPHRMMERGMERGIERAMERGMNGDVDIDYDRGRNGETNVTFTGGDGEGYTVTAGEDVKIPDTWPQSVPIPNNARVTYAGTMMVGQPGGGTTLAFETNDSATAVALYYENALSSNGWTIVSTMVTGEGSMLNAGRENGEGAVVYISATDQGTMVNLSVSAAN